MKLLVLTSEPISAQQLRDALPGDLEPQDAEVMLVTTAFHDSALRFWVSDADDAIARADAIRRESVDERKVAERFGRAVDCARIADGS
jgi:hypothetical protein